MISNRATIYERKAMNKIVSCSFYDFLLASSSSHQNVDMFFCHNNPLIVSSYRGGAVFLSVYTPPKNFHNR